MKVSTLEVISFRIFINSPDERKIIGEFYVAVLFFVF